MLWRSALRSDCTAVLAFSRVAELASIAALTTLRQLRRVRSRSALRAPTEGLRSSSPQKSPPPGTARRAAPVCGFRREHHQCVPQRRVRAGCSAPLGRRAAQGSRPRAQRESSTDSSQLFERSERSDRSEFCDGAARPSSAGKSERSADRTSEALRPARTRLCRATLRPRGGRSATCARHRGKRLWAPASRVVLRTTNAGHEPHDADPTPNRTHRRRTRRDAGIQQTLRRAAGAGRCVDDGRSRQLPCAARRKRRRQVHAGESADRLLQRRHRQRHGRWPRAGHPQPARRGGAGHRHDLPALHGRARHDRGREPGAGAARPGRDHRLEGRARAPECIHGDGAIPAEAGRACGRAGGGRKAEARNPQGAVFAASFPGAGRTDVGAHAAGGRRSAGPDEEPVRRQGADGVDHHAQVPRGLRLLRRGHRAAPRTAHRRHQDGGDDTRRTGRLDDGREHRRGLVHQRRGHCGGSGHGCGQQRGRAGRGAGRRPRRRRRAGAAVPRPAERRAWPSRA